MVNAEVCFMLFFHLQVTVISSFVFPSLPPQPLNIFFAVCILLACGSTIVLVMMLYSTKLAFLYQWLKILCNLEV